MNNKYTLLIQKLFTDRSIAENHLGEINQAMIHIIKLEYRFDYERDKGHHIRSIVSWLHPIAVEVLKDRLSKGPTRVMQYYVKSINPLSLLNSWTIYLRKNYGFEGRLTMDDFDIAFSVVTTCIGYFDRSMLKDYLERIYR